MSFELTNPGIQPERLGCVARGGLVFDTCPIEANHNAAVHAIELMPTNETLLQMLANLPVCRMSGLSLFANHVPP